MDGDGDAESDGDGYGGGDGGGDGNRSMERRATTYLPVFSLTPGHPVRMRGPGDVHRRPACFDQVPRWAGTKAGRCG